VVCSTIHFGAVSPALSRIRVAKLEEIGIDMAVACLSCLEKYCLSCPSDALSVGEKGEIRLDAGLCSGCQWCVEACPVGAVGFSDGLPIICDLCGGDVACISACPSQALLYREDIQPASLEHFMPSEGNPGEKRVRWTFEQGRGLRESWNNGARICS
jgi:carbon-monoxide dehydrogenase iron sulfur subunit